MTDKNETITLDLEEVNELLFKVVVEGTDPSPARIRLVCEGENDFSYMFVGKPNKGDIVQFVIPSMSGKLKEGTYTSRVEVLVENRCFVPVEFDLNFKKTVKVVAEVYRPVLPPPPKVSVTATPVIAKRPQAKKNIAETVKKEDMTNEEIHEWAKTLVNGGR